MKIFYIFTLFFLLLGEKIFSQDAIVKIDSLPAQGILLDKGWKFYAGDDSAWASPEFNDNDWESINPTLDIRHIPQFQKTNIGWLRLKLQVDSSLKDEPLGMLLSQVGASEIYLDGRLLYKFGTVSSEKQYISTHYFLRQPFAIKLDTGRFHVLAVRYSYNQKSFLIKYGNPNFCLNIVINTAATTFYHYQKEARRSLIYEMSMMSIWLLLSLISFCLYYLYRTQKAYLYVGIYGFLIFCWSFTGGQVAKWLINTDSVSFALFITFILSMLANPCGLNGVYHLYKQKKTWFFYFLILFGLFALISVILFYDWAYYFYIISILLYSIEYLSASIKAMRNKRPGAIILVCTGLLYIFSLIGAAMLVSANSIDAAYFWGFFGIVIIAIGWSLFMAGEFARTGLSLQARVKEVEHLSQKVIAEEQEKQQILSSQKETLEKQVTERTAELKQSLQELKSAQAQLIQSEKMASLGELTAGIAHEIQNPLNFVNNFSDVNKELLVELKEEIDKGNLTDVKSIADDLIHNEEKINHHGKRADAIVKNMLQHSRTSSGKKEPTDINALADEYLRLSYHGLRAKDKSFNATMRTDFDETIGNINIIPQDIGRVILNLINNAFYVVDEKNKQHPDRYEPTVSVSTKKTNGKVEVRVADNGNGIPKKVLDKIFQPFFTTKPTGQGTGLGLSLSYDIVKAHGGELKVETNEGEGTTFMIALPLENDSSTKK